MKIFCDSADLKNFFKYKNYNLVKGFTTNPSLMRSSGAKNYKSYALKLIKNSNSKPISLEVFSDDIDEMYDQALKINTWSKNIYVKIPIINTKGIYTNKTIKKLSNKGVKLNITAVYTFKQVREIIKNINKKSKVIISIFAGRMADQLIDPIPIFKKTIKFTKKYSNVQILWASTRETYNFVEAQKIGCDIITMPPKLIDQIRGKKKTQLQLTQETVKGFYLDSVKSKFKI